MSHEIRVLIIAGNSPDPHLRQREHKINLLRPHSGTLLRRLLTLRTRTMMAVTPLIRAICRNTCEMNSICWLLAWTTVKTMLRFQVWTIHSLETACLKLAELPEALAIVHVARRGASDSNRHSRASPAGKGKSRQPFGRQRVQQVHVISDRAMTDLLRSSEDSATASTTQRHGFASKVGQTKSTQRLSCVWPGRTLGRISSMLRSSCQRDRTRR